MERRIDKCERSRRYVCSEMASIRWILCLVAGTTVFVVALVYALVPSTLDAFLRRPWTAWVVSRILNLNNARIRTGETGTPPANWEFPSSMQTPEVRIQDPSVPEGSTLRACRCVTLYHSHSTFTLAKMTRTNVRLDLNETYPSMSASAYATIAEYP